MSKNFRATLCLIKQVPLFYTQETTVGGEANGVDEGDVRFLKQTVEKYYIDGREVTCV